jgi:hypothetical protein
MATTTKDEPETANPAVDNLEDKPLWARPPEEEDRAQRPSRHHPDDAHPLLNPYQGYTIVTHNKLFSGKCYGVTFLEGRAKVEGVTPEDLDEDIQTRRNFLHYVFNSRSTLEPVLELDPRTNKYVQTGVTRHPTFVVTPL